MRAKFHGECPACGQEIRPGQEIERAGFSTESFFDMEAPIDFEAQWAHKRCPKKAEPCRVCWLVHPEGECDR